MPTKNYNQGSIFLQSKGSVLAFLLAFAVSTDFRFDFFGISLSTGEVIVLLVWLSLAVDRRYNFFGSISGIDRIDLLMPFLYLIWTFIVFLVSFEREIFQVFRDVFFASLIYYFSILICFQFNVVSFLAGGFVFGVFVNLVISLSQIFSDWPRIVSLDSHGASFKESIDGETVSGAIATGVFAHPNGLGALLVVVLPFFVGIFFSAANNKHRYFLLFLFVLSIIVLYFTHSKGAIVWSFVGLISLFVARIRFFNTRNSLVLFSILFVSSVIAIIVFVLLPYMLSEGKGGTILTRLILANIFHDNLISGEFDLIFGNNQIIMHSWSSLYSSFDYPNAHNSYINQVVYFGFVALVLLIIFIIRGLIVSASRINDRDLQIIYSALTGLIGVMYFEPMHQSISGFGLVYFLIALAVILRKRSATSVGHSG